MAEIKAETVKKEKTTIVVAETTQFEGDMKTNLVSSIEMADIVSGLFGAAFADYYGCNVRINTGNTATVNPIVNETVPIGSIYVDLFFKDKGNAGNKIKNLKLRGQANPNNKNGSDMGRRYEAVMAMTSSANNGRVYDVTTETYEALEEFMNIRNVRWAAHTQEISANMGIIGTKEEAVVCITGLSLDRILTKIYGTEDEDGRYEYIATPSTIIPTHTSEFIMQVCQLNLDVVRKLQRELGINVPANSQFHVYC